MNRFLTTAAISGLALVSSLGMASSQQAEDPDEKNKVMFVLDGSNSMWGQIDGTAKISIAKDVMTDLIANLDPTMEMGLMAYGHRKKNECGDIEVLALPGPVDRGQMIEHVQNISPRGKTPISGALTIAALSVNSFSGKSSVVLVSDGLETCEADPCATARNLGIINPGFDVHVVGFDVTREESESLQCIADATGGKFFRANNANELKDALTQTVAAVGGSNEPQAPATETAEATKPKAGTFLYTKLCDTCKRQKPLDANWNVFKDGKPHYAGLGVVYANDADFTPGKYVIAVRYLSSNLTARGEVEIGEDGQQIGAINLNGGNAVLNAFATDDKNISASPILYEFFPIVDGKVGESFDVNAFSNDSTWLPAGKYKVTAEHQGVEAETEIDIIAGQQTDYIFDMRVGYIQPQFVLSAGEKPIRPASSAYSLIDVKTNKQVVSSSLAFNERKAVKPGEYILRTRYFAPLGEVSGEFPVTIKTGEILDRDFVLNAGRFNYEIKTPNANNKFFVMTLHPVDENGKSLKKLGGNINRKHSGVAPSGKYRFEMYLGGTTHYSDPFEIIAGQTQTINVTIP
ncbi:vWA domain-containing protein [Lentilitoribacter sp. EG35]|uniref:vWA domain-containing protein n=1 Tax=Lentilitoribacter sp. EG35 TaxID=3234192 RepID=UPI00345FC62A